ncbi:MAG: hypothetical protein IIW42_02550, partial [Bacteroidaceae bacterium]|nr:hypothetical protein [Bacteroidaceae bacterium]
LPARPCPARPLLHPPAQTARHRGYMARHAGSRVHDLSHHIGLLPQKKMPEMNDTALAIMLIGAYLPPRT